jgi:predicted permease
VLGRTIVVDGIARTIVGVAPADFRFPSPNGDLWLPASFDPTVVGKYWGTGHLRLLGRLRPGVERGAARAEAAAIIDRARSAFPWRMPDAWGTGVDVVPLQQRVVGGVGPTLLVLLGGVGVVLLIACVNVANLFLGRAAAREREIAIRAAIGAGRGRVVRQLLTESVVLALAGAAAGLALAGWTLRALVRLLPPEVPRVAEIGVDGRVFAFTTVLALATGIAFGLVPALRASRPDLRAALASGGRTGTGERRRLSEVLVVVQVALAVVLVASAGLLLKSFWRLRGESIGFRAERVVVAEVPVPAFPRDTTPRARAFYVEVLERMRGIPGVRAAAFASEVPFGGRGSMRSSFAAFVEAHPTAPTDVPPMLVRTVVTPEFFDALDIPLRRGRTFTAEDRAGATRVAVVDEYTAKRLWPAEDPLGQRVRRIWRDDEWITVVGVVGDVKRDSLSSAGETVIYLPLAQEPFDFVGSMYAIARSDLPAGVLAPRLRAAVAAVDPDVPVAGIASLDHLVAESAARPRFTALLLASFAGLALVLGAVGIYGVISYAVARRTREIGVRVALGAGTGDVLGMVLREGGALAGAGLVVGLVAALAAGPALSGLLYGVAPSDPMVLGGVAAILGAVALAASLVPARRAAAVDPLVAMRAD